MASLGATCGGIAWKLKRFMSFEGSFSMDVMSIVTLCLP